MSSAGRFKKFILPCWRWKQAQKSRLKIWLIPKLNLASEYEVTLSFAFRVYISHYAVFSLWYWLAVQMWMQLTKTKSNSSVFRRWMLAGYYVLLLLCYIIVFPTLINTPESIFILFELIPFIDFQAKYSSQDRLADLLSIGNFTEGSFCRHLCCINANVIQSGDILPKKPNRR